MINFSPSKNVRIGKGPRKGGALHAENILANPANSYC
jgi:hypothetical protein